MKKVRITRLDTVGCTLRQALLQYALRQGKAPLYFDVNVGCDYATLVATIRDLLQDEAPIVYVPDDRHMIFLWEHGVIETKSVVPVPRRGVPNPDPMIWATVMVLKRRYVKPLEAFQRRYPEPQRPATNDDDDDLIEAMSAQVEMVAEMAPPPAVEVPPEEPPVEVPSVFEHLLGVDPGLCGGM